MNFKIFILLFFFIVAGILGYLISILFQSDVGNNYYIITKDYTRADFAAENITIAENTVTLTGYKTVNGNDFITGDYILNKSDVKQIMYEKKIIYPENGVKLSAKDKILHGDFYFVTSYLIVYIAATATLALILLYISQYLFKAFRVTEKQSGIITNWLKKSWWLSQEIVLPGEAQGIIATRDWNYDKGKGLKSANQGVFWTSLDMKADEKPTSENDKGIYAYRLGTNKEASWAKISGIVSLSGHCIGHEGGLIRAERCKILMLFCPFPARAKELSSRYGVPVMCSLDKRADIEQWLITHAGISWLKHNADIINGTKAEYEIDEILKRESF